MSVDQTQVWKQRIVDLIRDQRLEDALNIILTSDADPTGTNPEFQELLAVCYFRMGRMEDAAEVYRNLAKGDLQNGKPLINLGAILNRLHRFDEAIAQLRKAIQREPRNADAYYNMGIAYRGQQQTQLAISSYREALRLQPEFEQAYVNLGNIYIEAGNTKEANKQYRQALEINPNSESARKGLQHAQHIEYKNNLDHNPFGRLVNVESITSKKKTKQYKQLNDMERVDDRNEVSRLSKSAKSAAEYASEKIRTHLSATLLDLARAVIEDEIHPGQLAIVYEKFKTEIPRVDESKRYLNRALLELRGHEEFMNTPDVNP